jgi:hypothetical protein
MLKTVLITILKPALYAAIPIVCGLLVAMINHTITTFHPSGEIQLQLWQLAVIPLLAGLAKLIARLATWKPEKVGK